MTNRKLHDIVTIKELIAVEDIEDSYPVMKELRPDYTMEQYVAAVRQQNAVHGYKLFGAYDGRSLVGVAGAREGNSLAWGHYYYIDDLVVSAAVRSKGVGGALLKHLKDYARERGCNELHLDSGVQRNGAHRFYLQERMDIVFFHFKMKL